jgi:hypothetical protein
MNNEELFVWNTNGRMILASSTIQGPCMLCTAYASFGISLDKFRIWGCYCNKHVVKFHRLCSNPLKEPKIHHMMIYDAIIKLELSDQTIFNIGLVLFPHMQFSSYEEIFSFDQRIVHRTAIEGAQRIIRICQDVNTRAKAAIVVLWQLPMLHKDVRLMIAKWLWRDRIEWLQ